MAGCLFLAVGGGAAAGYFYGKSKNEKEVSLLNQMHRFYTNVSNHTDTEQNINKLWDQVHRNMHLLGQGTIREIVSNPEMYNACMDMFSESPEDIINDNNG